MSERSLRDINRDESYWGRCFWQFWLPVRHLDNRSSSVFNQSISERTAVDENQRSIVKLKGGLAAKLAAQKTNIGTRTPSFVDTSRKHLAMVDSPRRSTDDWKIIISTRQAGFSALTKAVRGKVSTGIYILNVLIRRIL